MTITLHQTILAGCIAAFISGCSDNNGAVASVSADLPPSGGGDLSLQKKHAPDAPEGATAFTVETLADGLVNPWSISFFPDGTILVTERPGRIRAIRNGVMEAQPIAGTPEVFSEGQGGLFDILPHPDYEENNIIFLSYAYGSNAANHLRIARATFNGEAVSDLKVIYDATPPKAAAYHFGGRLVWGPDDKLYFTIGEGSRYKEKAQDMATSYGAVIRLNEDGSTPDDNPDFGEGSLPELYSKGHRNPQGLAYDGARGILWEHEHGAMGGDEINIIKPGANYGWPIATYGIDYNGARITPFTEYEGTTQPFKYWTPSIAPSGLAVYRGDLFQDWGGDLLVGAMGRTALHRIIMDGDKEIGEERYLIGERIRDVRIGPDGAIYVTTEDHGGAPTGKLLRLTPQ